MKYSEAYYSNFLIIRINYAAFAMGQDNFHDVKNKPKVGEGKKKKKANETNSKYQCTVDTRFNIASSGKARENKISERRLKGIAYINL